MDLELHKKGDGINFVKVWNESLGRRESVGTEVWEEEVELITPSEAGGSGLRSLCVEPSFTTRTDKKRERSRHTGGIHTGPGWQGARALWLTDERRGGRLRRGLGLDLKNSRRSRTIAFVGGRREGVRTA